MEKNDIPVTVHQENGVAFVVGRNEVDLTDEGVVVNGELFKNARVEWGVHFLEPKIETETAEK